MEKKLDSPEKNGIVSLKINLFTQDSTMPAEQTGKPLIQVLERAFDILEMLARRDTPMRATDIANELGLSLQTTGNLLRTLYERGYLSQDAKRFYRLGGQCFYLGSYADRWKELRKAADRAIPELCKTTGLLVFVGVIESDKLFCISLRRENEIDPPSQKWADELHSTASGRLLLAGLSPEERKKLLARTLRKKTRKTITDPDQLERICATIRKQGFAEIHGESVDQIHSIAVPIRNRDGEIIAALALSGDKTEWNKTSRKEKLERMTRTANAIRL